MHFLYYDRFVLSQEKYVFNTTYYYSLFYFIHMDSAGYMQFLQCWTHRNPAGTSRIARARTSLAKGESVGDVGPTTFVTLRRIPK